MKRDIKMQFLILLAAVSCVLVLPACGENQNTPEPDENILIYAAPVSYTHLTLPTIVGV